MFCRVAAGPAVCGGGTEGGGTRGGRGEPRSGLTAVVEDDQGVSFSLWQPAAGF